MDGELKHTKVYEITDCAGHKILGYIKFHITSYGFQPEPGNTFTSSFLRDIINECECRNQEYKKAKSKKEYLYDHTN